MEELHRKSTETKHYVLKNCWWETLKLVDCYCSVETNMRVRRPVLRDDM